MVEVSYRVDETKDFARYIKSVSKKVSDLTIPLKMIAARWYKGNQAIFSLVGPGKYKDLKEKYKKIKTRKYGSPYPILKATGRLEKSITERNSAESHMIIDGKQELILGSKTPYAKYLQYGTRNMPARPPILSGAEQVAPDGVKKNFSIWKKILQDYVEQAVGE